MAQASPAAVAAVESEQAVLRVLAGPQRGAELPLLAGDYLVGSSEACDVVLADAEVAVTHLLLTVAGDGVTVTARDKAVALEAQVLRPGEQADLTLPAALTFGLTSIGLGVPGSDLSGLALPAAPQALPVAPEAEPAEEEEATGTAPADDGKAPSEDATPAEGGEATEAAEDSADEIVAETPATEAVPEPTAEKSRRRWPLWLALFLAVAAAAVIAWLWFGRASSEEAAAAPAAAPLSKHDAVAAVVDGLGLAEVRVERGPTGAPLLAGYVPDVAAQREIEAALQTAGLQAEDRTRQVEAMMDAVSLTLASFSWPAADFGRHLRTSYAGNGVVMIDGFLGPEVDRSVLRRRLLGDVPGIAGLEFTRSGLKEWKDILDRRLTEAGLGQWLTTEPTAGLLRVSGEVTEKEAEAWRAVGQGFVNDSGGWPKLAIAVTSARPGVTPVTVSTVAMPEVGAEQVAAPEAPVDMEHPEVIGVILSHQKPARVLLAGGLSLLQGESLANGITVKSVTADRVVFHKDEREFVVYVKESK